MAICRIPFHDRYSGPTIHSKYRIENSIPCFEDANCVAKETDRVTVEKSNDRMAYVAGVAPKLY